MNKHTPGPWMIRETRDGMTVRRNRRRLEIVAPCEGGGEMVIVGKHTGLDCLRYANARLIASVPELLDAAKAALARFKEDGCEGYHEQHPASLLEAAIAKAEGRQGE